MKTKLRLLILLLSVFIKAEAQFVTIPDPAFVHWLDTMGFSSCLNGNQMDTTCADIVNATSLYLSNEPITDVTGLQYFDNVAHITFQNMSDLVILNALPPSLLSLGLLTVPNLTTIASLPPSLEALYANYCSLGSLPVLPSGLTVLEVPFCMLNSLQSLPPGLEFLNISDNPITTLPTIPSSLQQLNCSGCSLTSIPVLPSSLIGLDCHYNQLTALPSLPAGLVFLNLSDNPAITCLPPVPSATFVYWWNTAINCIPHIITGDSIIPSMDGMPLCNIYNNNGCDVHWSISGTVYMEANMNCNMDSAEVPLHGIKVQLYQNGLQVQQTYTNSLGEYSFFADSGTYQCLVDSSELMVKVCPLAGFYAIAIDSLNMFSTQNNFGMICQSDFDIGVSSCVSLNPIRPGTLSHVNIVAGDLISSPSGSLCISSLAGSVVVVMDGPISFYSAEVGALTPVVSGDTLTYLVSDFSQINPGNDFNFIIYADPGATINDTVCFYVTVSPFSGDMDTTNNVSTCCFPVVNSYDPNDKMATFEGITDTSVHWITYTIRFQNTGNAPAIDIYIIDTLDVSLDPSSVQLLSYSHEPVFQATGHNLIFNYPDINLPDSINDEPNSHGYVQYKVRRKANLPLGTEITNTAFIYFDFNAPVVTNTTSTIFDILTSVNLFNNDQKAILYPNPLSRGQSLKMRNDRCVDRLIEIIITDISGKQVLRWKGYSDNIYLHNLTTGMYNLQFICDREITNTRLIIYE